MWRMSMVMLVSPAAAVTTPGQHCACPTVVTPSWRSPISAIAEREACRRPEAVAAHGHRHRAGVAGLPGEDHPLALDALRAGDRADAEALVLEHRALLDVHLDVGLDVGHAGAGAVEVLDVDAVLAEHVGQRVALLVGQPAQHVDVERADRRRRAEQAAAEAGALLVGPVDEGDGHRRRALGGERAQQFEAGHHAQRTVEPAALGHAVEVAADDEHLRALAAQHGPQVAGLVGVDLDRQGGQRLAQQRARPRASRASSTGACEPSGPPVRSASSRRSDTTLAGSNAPTRVTGGVVGSGTRPRYRVLRNGRRWSAVELPSATARRRPVAGRALEGTNRWTGSRSTACG